MSVPEASLKGILLVHCRYRHLLNDLEVLLPHARKDSKFESKGNLGLLNEIAELSNCNNTLYMEIRKKQDLYMWLAKTPHGPSSCFLIQNVHTMDELKMTGNCLKGSRPILSFDQTFDTQPHYQLMKEMLIQVFFLFNDRHLVLRKDTERVNHFLIMYFHLLFWITEFGFVIIKS